MDFINKKIAIIGFNREWQSTLRFLLRSWVMRDNITILDKDPSIEAPLNILTITGEDYLKNLWEYDILIGTPWLSPYTPEIWDYRTILTSQMEIFFSLFQWKVIGITATKWKSTTSTLIYECLRAGWKKVALIWNIGTPVLESIDFDNPPEYVVYEMSSYMLEYYMPHCHIAILWNIYPDHLTYHHGFENYKNAKLKILIHAEYKIIGEQVYDFIENTDEIYTIVPSYEGYSYNEIWLYHDDEILIRNSDIKLLWEHNKRNILTVFATTDKIWIDRSITRGVCQEFGGLPHRLEFVGEFRGILFYDDAISTTPESTIEWIKSLWGNVDTIFLGWKDRGYAFEALVEALWEYKISNVVLFPDSGKKILPLLKWLWFNIQETSSMQEAVNFAYRYTKQWKICLLSCASPSYSLWKNFEEKGAEFQKYIKMVDSTEQQ